MTLLIRVHVSRQNFKASSPSRSQQSFYFTLWEHLQTANKINTLNIFIELFQHLNPSLME